ncbi:MAG: hypothetical protein SCARUB_04367, partial [Candidatus Scalindua rubra]
SLVKKKFKIVHTVIQFECNECRDDTYIKKAGIPNI